MDVDLEQLIAAVEETASDDPIERVSAAAVLKEQLEQLGDELLDHFVKEARDRGCSWSQIGDALGVSRQAAQQRSGGLVDQLLRGVTSPAPLQRFTAKARAAVVAAQAAAREHNHGYIGTEHILLGLFANEDENVAVVALRRLGVERAAVERMVDERVERGAAPVRGHIPFTPRAKKTLEVTLNTALGLGHNYIGTEHILLALRQIEDGMAAAILADLGVSEEALRPMVIQILTEIVAGRDPT